MSKKTIELTTGPSLGFRMCGGRDTNLPLKIARVNPGSAASDLGIREGDLVASLNGQNVENLTNSEVQSILKNSGPSITLELRSAKRHSLEGGSNNQTTTTNETSSSSQKQVPSSTNNTNTTGLTTKGSSSTSDITNITAATGETSVIVPEDVKSKSTSSSPEKTTTKEKSNNKKSSKKKFGFSRDSRKSKSNKEKSEKKVQQQGEEGEAEATVEKGKSIEQLRQHEVDEGVWTPGSTDNSQPTSPITQSETTIKNGGAQYQGEQFQPIWTPPSAPSPSSQRKFRPVNFNAPSSPTISQIPRPIARERAPSPPTRTYTNGNGQSSNTSEPQKIIIGEQNTTIEKSSSAVHLPKYQSPTVTLLQKAREGILPKGANYLEQKTPVTRSFSASGISSNTGGRYYSRQQQQQQQPSSYNSSSTPDTHFGVQKDEQDSATEGRKVDQLPKRVPPIPISLRSGVKSDQQREWYRRMYESLHVDKPQQSGRIPNKTKYTSGSWSEPEGYESDTYTIKYQTLDRRKRGRNTDYDYAEPFYQTSSSSVPGIRFTPGRIEDYIPGSSSETLKSRQIRQHLPTLRWALGSKDLGYESDSNLIIRKRDQDLRTASPLSPLSPAEQKHAYAEIQRGGEVPLQGLRKLAPERPRAYQYNSTIMSRIEEVTSKRRSSPSPVGSKIRQNRGGIDSPLSVRSGSPSLYKSPSPTTVEYLEEKIEAKLNRSNSDLNPTSSNKVVKGRSISQSAKNEHLRYLHTVRTVRKSGIPVGSSTSTTTTTGSAERLRVNSPELRSPREVQKLIETTHKLTIKVEEYDSPKKAAGESKKGATVREETKKSGVKKPLRNGNGKSTLPSKTKTVKISVERNGAPSKPPRVGKSESSDSEKGSKPQKVTRTLVTPVAIRHAGCLSPHPSRPASPGSNLGVSTSSLSNLTPKGGSLSQIPTPKSIKAATDKKTSTNLTKNYPLKKSSSVSSPYALHSATGVPSTTTTAKRITSSTSSLLSPKRKLTLGVREAGDGHETTSSKVNRISSSTLPTSISTSLNVLNPRKTKPISIKVGSETEKMKTKPSTKVIQKTGTVAGQQQQYDTKKPSPTHTTMIPVVSLSPSKPIDNKIEVKVAERKLTTSLSPRFHTIPRLPKVLRDFSSYEYLAYDDSTVRSLPTLTPYLKEAQRVSNSAFFLRHFGPSISTPRPTLTSILRERIGIENRCGIKRTSSLQSLQGGRREYSMYVHELQQARRKSPRFVQLHRLYSSLERLGQLEKSTSMYDIPILSLERQLDFDSWWKLRNRIKVDEEIAAISAELANAQRNREFFFRPKRIEEFRWKGDSALRIKKWTIDELKHFLSMGSWLKKPELWYKSEMDLHKTAWRGSSVKEIALNIEVAGSAKTHEEFYKNLSPTKPFGWLRRAFSMSSTLSDEQREHIRTRLGKLINRIHISEVHERKEIGRASPTRSNYRPVITTPMGVTTSSVPVSSLYRSDSGRSTGSSAGFMTEAEKKQLSRTLSQEFREKKIIDGRNKFKRQQSDGGDSSDNSGKTVIHIPVTSQVLLQKQNKATNNASTTSKSSNTFIKPPPYSIYCANTVPSKVTKFEHYYRSQEQQTRSLPGRKSAKPQVSFSTSTGTNNSSLIRNKNQLQQQNQPHQKESGQHQHRDIQYRSTASSSSPTPTLKNNDEVQDKYHPSQQRHYMSHVNVISRLASLLLQRDEQLRRLVTREILERDKLEQLRLSNFGEVDRLRYFYETYYPTRNFVSSQRFQPEVNLLRCLFCSDPDLARLTSCRSPHHMESKSFRRCASADIFKGKLDSYYYDRSPEGCEASPLMSTSPELYFNSRSRKPIYQPSSIPNVCQPTLTAHSYLESPTKSLTSYSSEDYSSYGIYGDGKDGGYTSTTGESLTTSISPTPSSSILAIAGPSTVTKAIDSRFKSWNYDPSLHQPKYRYVPPQPYIPTTILNTPTTTLSPSSSFNSRRTAQSPKPSSVVSLPITRTPRRTTSSSSEIGDNRTINAPNEFRSLDRTTIRKWNSTTSSQDRFPMKIFRDLPTVPPSRYFQYRRFLENQILNKGFVPVNNDKDNKNDIMDRKFDISSERNYDIESELLSSLRTFNGNKNNTNVQLGYQGLVKNSANEQQLLAPRKYAESEVNIHYKAPVRLEEKRYIPEEELRARQISAMKRFYEEQKQRKYLQEIYDMENRRHMDNFTPSQKSPIPLNRYEDVIESKQSWQQQRERTPEQKPAAKALYNFVARNARELSFKKGDILYIRRRLDPNWYEGELNAAVGIFPTSYVQVISSHYADRATPRSPAEGQARVLYNFAAQTAAEMSVAKGETVVLIRKVDMNWYEGRIGARQGIIPVPYIHVLREPGPHLKSLSPKPVGAPAAHSLVTQNGGIYSSNAASHGYKPNQYSFGSDYNNIQNFSPKPRTPLVCGSRLERLKENLTIDTKMEPLTYRALYNYRPAHEDELELHENDLIYVIEKCEDGWYVGSSQSTGNFGTFPGNYVERVY